MYNLYMQGVFQTYLLILGVIIVMQRRLLGLGNIA